MQQQISASGYSNEDLECDFFTKQAKLQIEARMALAQAKEMAHMQMEVSVKSVYGKILGIYGSELKTV